VKNNDLNMVCHTKLWVQYWL